MNAMNQYYFCVGISEVLPKIYILILFLQSPWNGIWNNLSAIEGFAPALTAALVDARKKPVFCLSH